MVVQTEQNRAYREQLNPNIEIDVRQDIGYHLVRETPELVLSLQEGGERILNERKTENQMSQDSDSYM